MSSYFGDKGTCTKNSYYSGPCNPSLTHLVVSSRFTAHKFLESSDRHALSFTAGDYDSQASIRAVCTGGLEGSPCLPLNNDTWLDVSLKDQKSYACGIRNLDMFEAWGLKTSGFTGAVGIS